MSTYGSDSIDTEVTVENSASELETDSECDTEIVSGSSDLDELYQSFDFDEEAEAFARSPTQHLGEFREPRSLSISNHPLHPGAKLSALESSLLLFEDAVHHSLTKNAFTVLLQLLSQ